MEPSNWTADLLVLLQRRGYQRSGLAAQPFDIYMAGSARVIYYRIYRTVESWDSEWPTQVSANVVASTAANELITRTLPVVDTHTTRTFTVRQQRLLGSQLRHSWLYCCHLRDSLPPRIGDLTDGAPMAGRWKANGRQTPTRAIDIDLGCVRVSVPSMLESRVRQAVGFDDTVQHQHRRGDVAPALVLAAENRLWQRDGGLIDLEVTAQSCVCVPVVSLCEHLRTKLRRIDATAFAVVDQ